MTHTLTVLLTGATGFIGSHVARRLLERGHSVICLVRSAAKASMLRSHGARLVEGTIEDPLMVREAMQGCDTVVHAAALYALWHPDPDAYRRVNVEGTATVVRAAAEARVRRLLLMSTALVYGRALTRPFREESPPGPRSPSLYVQSKWQGELEAVRLSRRMDLPLVVLYPGAVLGPGDPHPTGSYIIAFLERRLPARVFLNTTNTYVDVCDVAEAVCLALESTSPSPRYLVGTHCVTYRQLNRLLTELSGVPEPPLILPSPVVRMAARLIGRGIESLGLDPGWALSPDGISIVSAGTCFDGSRAVRELGLNYTPLRDTLQIVVEAWLRKRSRRT